MNEFALWFYRPIAEFLGTMALIAGLLLAAFIMFGLYSIYRAIVYRWKHRNDKRSNNV